MNHPFALFFARTGFLMGVLALFIVVNAWFLGNLSAGSALLFLAVLLLPTATLFKLSRLRSAPQTQEAPACARVPVVEYPTVPLKVSNR